MGRNPVNKIFAIGANKTGTTSLEQVFRNFGFRVGDQAVGELLIEDWARRDFRRIAEFCRTADAFQDIPFSLNYTYQVMDHLFPGSKFILTLRNNAEEWYDSLIRFHTQIVGANRLPTPDDLKNFGYRYKGWLWRVQELVYGIDESTLYEKDIYISGYERHNSLVSDYFRHRPEDLLVLNPADDSAMKSLCGFLNIKYAGQVMPKLNRSA